MAGNQQTNPPAYNEEAEVKAIIGRVPNNRWLAFAMANDGLGLDGATIQRIAPDSGNITPNQQLEMAQEWARRGGATVQIFNELVQRYVTSVSQSADTGGPVFQQNYNAPIHTKVFSNNVQNMNVS